MKVLFNVKKTPVINGVASKCSFVSSCLDFKYTYRNDIIKEGFPEGPVFKTSLPNAGVVDMLPGGGAMIPHVLWSEKQNIKQKQHCNKFSKDFNNGLHQKKSLKNKQLLISHMMSRLTYQPRQPVGGS